LDLELARDRILVTRQRLGNAYLQDENPQEAIKALEPAITFLEASGFATSIDEVLVMDLGRAYAAQKDFPRALEYLTKALAKAEARQHQSAIPGICTSIGQIFPQTGKPAEAVTYFKKAIDSIESTRSFLQSEELRTSFFENKGQTYGQIIQANIRAKKIRGRFQLQRAGPLAGFSRRSRQQGSTGQTVNNVGRRGKGLTVKDNRVEDQGRASKGRRGGRRRKSDRSKSAGKRAGGRRESLR
jgi:tetratricopeptide (TPR) repeat protein